MSGEGFLRFVDQSPSPFHAVEASARRLSEAGFERLNERDIWHLEPGKKYFFTRNQSTIAAFAVGGKVSQDATEPVRFVLYGAHTDSPCLKINPKPTDKSEGYTRISVSTYGGGLWHTWFDRDLTVAGRVVIHRTSADGQSKFVSQLVNLKRPVARVPNLAIHLTSADDRAAFNYSKETHLKPVLQTEIQEQLEAGASNQTEDPLLSAIAKELGCNVSDIRDFELCLADTQPAAIGGLQNEFVFAPRLDNQMMSYTGVEALVAATANVSALAQSVDVWGIALFDNEEVGSASAHGAGSPIMNEMFERVLGGIKNGNHDNQIVAASIRRSVLVSADMAHAVHPNYGEKHQKEHKPRIHEGLVIKINANQRYATTSTTALALREVARRHKLKVQDFVVKNDSPCGSTIGPIIAENTGLRTVDVGNAQLSMHSIREQCGVSDIANSVALFAAFFPEFAAIDDSVEGSD